jgi:rhodanese-related sulfurtransferase
MAADALLKAGIDNAWNVTGGVLALRDGSASAGEAHARD